MGSTPPRVTPQICSETTGGFAPHCKPRQTAADCVEPGISHDDAHTDYTTQCV